MKKLKYFLPAIAMMLFSCDDYLDVNTSPNDPQLSQITPDLALANAQTGPYRTMARRMNRLGNFFMNNWGMNVNSFAVTAPPEYSLAIDNNFYSDIWDNIYLNTANLTNIINHKAVGYDNHKAIAKIMKAFYFQYLVDIYGDIPYSEAHLGSENTSPKYDDDLAIYRDLVNQVDQAIAMMNTPGAIAVGSEDVIFKGDMSRWEEFGNTLKLRLLLRQTDSGVALSTYLSDGFASLAGKSFLNADAKINPGYSKAGIAQQNPFYALLYQVDETTENQEMRFVRASKYMGDKLNSGPTDPRRGRLFSLIGGTVQGVIQGDLAVVNGGTAPASISTLGPALVKNSAQDGFVMTLAESKFLQAEAAHEGYLAGDAQTLFNEGITASMAQLGATPGTYVVDVNLVAGKGYGAIGATAAQQLEAIMYQKNIALQGGLNALESFIEYTRTGLIDTIPLTIVGATQPNKPRRLLYPNSELVGNTANVPAQSVNSAFSTGPFWY
ncbi:SusD/RagB family nutrient-binding outer membrane lipoprotein [Flavobacterium amnicola]|uniref:SusD/RagB family nutrient-binding outer membrane lipoprotein n=1 Tax=Flavobacterium amnicola TaxID=2506422 RepID=A0A4V1N247_9FLAO|nr:SusD/RagB family nutrient-binding outer membrane lipoprotein [Flavobacterium amnicola]RXR20461.1 SusD/RagB family nutrient-binding outer membrane lipoprotein [Flavobacterium amnicola]